MKNSYKAQQKRLQKKKKRQNAIKSSGSASGSVKKYRYGVPGMYSWGGAGDFGREIFNYKGFGG